MTVWKESLREFSHTKNIALMGILMALSVALKFVASIDIGQYIRIGISDIPGVFASMLFGPAAGGIFWGAGDVIKYLVAPNGPYFPGFTLSAVLNGIIFGFLLYKKPMTVGRVLVSEIISKVVVSVGLNTLWLCMLYGNAFFAMLPARALSNLIMLPIDTAIVTVFVKSFARIVKRESYS